MIFVSCLICAVIIIIIIIILLLSLMMVFHWSLRDRESPQVSRSLLSILVDLNNDVFWMVSSYPLIYKPSSPFSNPLRIAPSAPNTIGIIVTFVFQSFFLFSSKVKVLICLFAFFQFYSVVCRNTKSTIRQVIYFFFFYYHSVWSSGQH